MPVSPPREGRQVGEVAYDFTLKDLDGREYRLKDRRGKQVVHLVFWATWCVPCVEEVPHLREVYERYRDQGLEIVGIVVPMNQTKEGVRAFVEKFRMTYPILWDEGLTLMDRYRIDSIPRNILVGRDGVIRYAGTGLPADYEDLVRRSLAPAPGPQAAAR
jgi:peroxiredoxin